MYKRVKLRVEQAVAIVLIVSAFWFMYPTTAQASRPPPSHCMAHATPENFSRECDDAPLVDCMMMQRKSVCASFPLGASQVRPDTSIGWTE